jgi:hypothetical protein
MHALCFPLVYYIALTKTRLHYVAASVMPLKWKFRGAVGPLRTQIRGYGVAALMLRSTSWRNGRNWGPRTGRIVNAQYNAWCVELTERVF